MAVKTQTISALEGELSAPNLAVKSVSFFKGKRSSFKREKHTQSGEGAQRERERTLRTLNAECFID